MDGKWYVTYKVPSMSADKVHKAGPYKSQEDAVSQRDDIQGYAGVTEVKLDVDFSKESPDGVL